MIKLRKLATDRGWEFSRNLTGNKTHLFKNETPRVSYFLYPVCSKNKVAYGVGNEVEDNDICEKCLAAAKRMNLLVKEG